MNPDIVSFISISGIAAGVYLMRRIACKIEKRMDQVEDHEKRLVAVETRCDIFHGKADE